MHPLITFQISSHKELASSKYLSFNYCIIFSCNNRSPSTTLYVTRCEFATSLVILLSLLQLVYSQKWAQYLSWGLNDAGSSALITSLFWVILLMQPKMLCEISKIGSIFYLQKHLTDTNTTLPVITVNEVNTLLFGCEYHT